MLHDSVQPWSILWRRILACLPRSALAALVFNEMLAEHLHEDLRHSNRGGLEKDRRELSALRLRCERVLSGTRPPNLQTSAVTGCAIGGVLLVSAQDQSTEKSPLLRL